MHARIALCACAVTVALLGGCEQSELSGRTDDAHHEQILRAGVHDYPAPLHGGVVMRAGRNVVELVVQPGGVVRVYPRDGGGVESDSRGHFGAYGTVTMRPEGGVAQTAVLAPDPQGGELFAQLPPPAGPATEYDLDVSFRGQRLKTGAAVLPGGTDATLQASRAAGDTPVIPTEAMGPPETTTDANGLAPAPPPSAVGGGPTH